MKNFECQKIEKSKLDEIFGGVCCQTTYKGDSGCGIDTVQQTEDKCGNSDGYDWDTLEYDVTCD